MKTTLNELREHKPCQDGWAFKFGIDASKYDWVIYLAIGMIRFQFIEEKNK